MFGKRRPRQNPVGIGDSHGLARPSAVSMAVALRAIAAVAVSADIVGVTLAVVLLAASISPEYVLGLLLIGRVAVEVSPARLLSRIVG